MMMMKTCWLSVLCLVGFWVGATTAFAPQSSSSSLPLSRTASLLSQSSTTTCRRQSTSTSTDEDATAAATADTDDETALTNAGLLKRDRYIATNRFAVRRNQQAKFEKRWATRQSKLATLTGFRYFQLMRRVKLGQEGKTIIYDQGETDDEAMENYVSFTIWEKKSHFSAWRNGEAFKEAHGGTSIGAFLSTMVNSAFVLRGAPRPAFYDALYLRARPPAVVPQTVNGWRQVETEGTETLPAESYMHMIKYYIPAEKMAQFEMDYQHVSAQDDPTSTVASVLMRRDARAKGHGVKEMSLDEPSYMAVRIFDDKQACLDFAKDDDEHASGAAAFANDYARKPAQVEFYEGTLVITKPEGA